jgi:RNA polymerase sigma factor (sigma-70 family)
MKTRGSVMSEDIAQDVFLDFYKLVPTLREGEDPLGLLFTIATRKAVNLVVKHTRHKRYMVYKFVGATEFSGKTKTSVISDPHGLDDNLRLKEDRQQILRAIWCLPAVKRKLVRMRHYSGLTMLECASLTNLSVGTVFNYLQDALTFIQRKVNQQAFSTPQEESISDPESGTFSEIIDSLSENEREDVEDIFSQTSVEQKTLNTLRRVLLCA